MHGDDTLLSFHLRQLLTPKQHRSQVTVAEQKAAQLLAVSEGAEDNNKSSGLKRHPGSSRRGAVVNESD